MDLLLTEEQGMLRDSAATFTERHGGAARLRDMRGSETKINKDIWHQAAEAGWLAILAPESSGGLNLGITELCLVAEELGINKGNVGKMAEGTKNPEINRLLGKEGTLGEKLGLVLEQEAGGVSLA